LTGKYLAAFHAAAEVAQLATHAEAQAATQAETKS
jgi:hypothetical protein